MTEKETKEAMESAKRGMGIFAHYFIDTPALLGQILNTLKSISKKLSDIQRNTPS